MNYLEEGRVMENKNLSFVCPKDFKSGRLIAGKYTIADLTLLISIIAISIITIITLIAQEKIILEMVFIAAIPIGVITTLTFPFANFHNILSFIKVFIIYLKKDKTYIYGGVRYYAIFKKK